MEQPLPKYFDILDHNELNTCFSNHDFVNKDLPIQVLSTGMKEIFLPVKDVETLNNLKPDFEEIIEFSIKHNVIGIHAFALSEEVDAYGRNFAPVVGINEESATGTSNGALGCYLYKYVKKKHKYILRQGYSMNLPSEIITTIKSEDNEIVEVLVGGTAKIINE